MTRTPKNLYKSADSAKYRQVIAINCKKARQKAGLTQAQVGEAFGYGKMGQGFISKIERAERNLTIDSFVRLAQILGVTIQELIKE